MRLKKFTAFFIATMFFQVSLSDKAQAQGWPTFDVAHTASEITGLISDITKTIEMPMEILSVNNLSKSLGPLGSSLGGPLMEQVKGNIGKAMSKVEMKKDDLSQKAKASLDQGVESVKKDDKILPQNSQNMTQEEYQEIKKERKKRLIDTASESYSLALAQRNLSSDDTEKKIQDIISQSNSAQDKRGAYTANTMAVVEVCNELILLATLEVARLKLESTEALNAMHDARIDGDIKAPSSAN